MFRSPRHRRGRLRGVDSISVEDLVAAIVEGVQQHPEPHAGGGSDTVPRLLALWREDPSIPLTDNRVMGSIQERDSSERQPEVDGPG